MFHFSLALFFSNSLQNAKDNVLAILWEAYVAKTVTNYMSPAMPVTAADVDSIAAGLTRKAKGEDGRSFEMGQEELLPV